MTTKSTPQPTADSQSAITEPAPLTPERAKELFKEGLELRREIEARFAQMRALTEEDLNLRTR